MGVGNGGLGVALSTPTMLRFEMTLLCSFHLVMHIWILLFLFRYTASCVDIISILLFVAYDAGLDVPFSFRHVAVIYSKAYRCLSHKMGPCVA
jgi:hypothetical protein